MKLWRWEYGRQVSRYWKFPLAHSKVLKFDAYIPRLPAWTDIALHNDPSLAGSAHHRVDITLRSALAGSVSPEQR